jgi:hypothetical protein
VGGPDLGRARARAQRVPQLDVQAASRAVARDQPLLPRLQPYLPRLHPYVSRYVKSSKDPSDMTPDNTQWIMDPDQTDTEVSPWEARPSTSHAFWVKKNQVLCRSGTHLLMPNPSANPYPNPNPNPNANST